MRLVRFKQAPAFFFGLSAAFIGSCDVVIGDDNDGGPASSARYEMSCVYEFSMVSTSLTFEIGVFYVEPEPVMGAVTCSGSTSSMVKGPIPNIDKSTQDSSSVSPNPHSYLGA